MPNVQSTPHSSDLVKGGASQLFSAVRARRLTIETFLGVDECTASSVAFNRSWKAHSSYYFYYFAVGESL
ncbi:MULTISPECIES: hypothetical protein [Brevibacterium]|uniref:hypothetical protein n=1 Tax=Brevibacterium TaxID=1696 RepID=UPI0019D2F9CD|nr:MULTISPECIES: hypothetical protein [Brevibacterium]